MKLEKNEKFNIVFSVDDNYCPQLSVAISSLLINSSNFDAFNIFVLNSSLSDENRKKLNNLKKIKNFDLTFLTINQEEFKNCPLSAHFALPTYYRIKLPSILHCDKVLYLDSDIVVKKSIKDFYNKSFNGEYAKVIKDIASDRKDILNQKEILNVKNYFNAGVMLLNLKKIREDLIEQKCFDFMLKNPEKILYVDQCVLNCCFQNNVEFIDSIYNFQHNNDIAGFDAMYKSKKNKIVILHFVSGKKPWLFNKSLDIICLYYKYLLKTDFYSNVVNDMNKYSSYKNIVRKIKKTIKCMDYYR